MRSHGWPPQWRFALSICLLGLLVFAVSCAASSGAGGRLPDQSSRTPAQRKLDSPLLQEIARRQGTPAVAPNGRRTSIVQIDQDGRALVDVRAPVTPQLQDTIRALKGTVVSTSARYDSTIAWLPVLQLEALAGDPAIVSIIAATKPLTNPRIPITPDSQKVRTR